jgi:hypothetical protein
MDNVGATPTRPLREVSHVTCNLGPLGAYASIVRGASPRFVWISNQLIASEHVVNTGQRSAGSNFSTTIAVIPQIHREGSSPAPPPPREHYDGGWPNPILDSK